MGLDYQPDLLPSPNSQRIDRARLRYPPDNQEKAMQTMIAIFAFASPELKNVSRETFS